jgi:uroporphyrinogen-III decarboxylase
MIRGQLYGTKWLLENIESDMGIGSVFVDFQNAQDASALGCETEVSEESGQIWIREGWVKTEADLEKLRRIDPTNTGLLAKARAFVERMREIGDRYVVRLKDGTELHPAANPVLTSATMGPFTVAAEVAGMVEVSTALIERPEWARELLSVVTDKIIEWMSFVERFQGMSSLWVADDYAGNLSLRQFRQFVLPCLLRIRQAFPDRHFGFHMCGKVDHLLRCLADELRIDEFLLFGYQVNKQLVQEVMGGRVVLGGNVNPMNIHSGTPESVFEESMAALRVFGRGSGGFILSDGANIPPDSPVENINAMMQASREFAREMWTAASR